MTTNEINFEIDTQKEVQKLNPLLRELSIYHYNDRIISEDNIMTILPSTSLRNQYNEISEKCKKSGEPIYLTKNGEGDLVVMSVEAFEKHQALLTLKERLLDIELEQKAGAKSYSLDELDSALRKIVANG